MHEKAILRIQALKTKHVHKFEFRRVELGVVLTSVAFLHPETAKKLSFDNLQLVVIEPRSPSIEAIQNAKDGMQKRGFRKINALMAVAKCLEEHEEILAHVEVLFHVELPAPGLSERGAILKHEILKRGLHCSDDMISELASKCDGYDAYDLGNLSSMLDVDSEFCLYVDHEILLDRAVHAASCRFLAFKDEELESAVLIKEDFVQAMHEFVPVAMRGLTKAGVEGGRTGWGGRWWS
ncbi:hypothetical protein HPP92_028546 [Vanilla planifolia]|uniref:Uncharacterized protein n=1 Tax=Vanilla planifolia TaxID=51239 RepID=A0A835P5M0_VANPL|nr:hypothetical protein HPP92_028546 [Vanilla planifolia]